MNQKNILDRIPLTKTDSKSGKSNQTFITQRDVLARQDFVGGDRGDEDMIGEMTKQRETKGVLSPRPCPYPPDLLLNRSFGSQAGERVKRGDSVMDSNCLGCLPTRQVSVAGTPLPWQTG